MPKAQASPTRAPRATTRAAAPDTGDTAVLERPAAPPPAPAPLPSAAPETTPLHAALLDSRQRWRDLVHLAADFAFETDAWGRFVFVSPDPALGWPAATLLGQTAELLLVETPGEPCFNPFRPGGPVRRRRAWLKRPDGSSLCLTFAAAPLLDPDGRIIGARGVGQDTSEQERREAEVAGALRRGEVLDHILWRMRKEVLAPRMMQAALDALGHATGCEGLAMVDIFAAAAEPGALYASGRPSDSAVATALALVEQQPESSSQGLAPDGRMVLVCPASSRLGGAAALVLWRAPGGRAWDGDERMLAGATAAILRVILEHDVLQREMARQARTDPLTGLLNRRAFLDELARRFHRLEVDGLPGALLFVDLDNFKALNDTRGHDAGDEALRGIARMLQRHCRATDLVARLGGDEFALWLDGADEFAAAERAECLRTAGPEAVAHLTPQDGSKITLSIGVAIRWPGLVDDIDELMGRADQAMYDAKRSGRGAWRVAPNQGP